MASICMKIKENHTYFFECSGRSSVFGKPHLQNLYFTVKASHAGPAAWTAVHGIPILEDTMGISLHPHLQFQQRQS
jgi:hypothetical protein